MKRIYGNLKMNWLSVILFAAITGIYTGIVMLIPALKDTSFQDIGIYYEWWVIFAVIVVVNCSKGWEAMLKCFVFFLISQPLIYAVEVLFGELPLEQAVYYYKSIWLPRTFLTLPGGFIAYYCKKQSMLGAIIMGLGNTIQMFLAVFYFGHAISNFPYHILSGIVCIVSVFVMSFQIQKEKKYRFISILIPFVLVVIIIAFAKLTGRYVF